MKVAVLILAHKDFEHITRQVLALDHPIFDFYIHVDLKSDINKFKEKLINTNLDKRVNLIPSINVKWASISQTEARLSLLKEAYKKRSYMHYIMLSGQCYPIKPVGTIIKLLEVNKEHSFIEHEPIPTPKLGINKGLDRIECYSYNIFGKKITHFTSKMTTTLNTKGKIINHILTFYHWFKKKRKFPSEVKPFYGIDWWILSNSAVNHILNFVKDNPDYHKYHKFTRHTSEVYFPSILAGTNYKEPLVNKAPHFMIWDKVNSAHPITLRENNFDEIRNSNALFARKFESKKSSELLNKIDIEILDKEDES